jgi:hypothetical protein
MLSNSTRSTGTPGHQIDVVRQDQSDVVEGEAGLLQRLVDHPGQQRPVLPLEGLGRHPAHRVELAALGAGVGQQPVPAAGGADQARRGTLAEQRHSRQQLGIAGESLLAGEIQR